MSTTFYFLVNFFVNFLAKFIFYFSLVFTTTAMGGKLQSKDKTTNYLHVHNSDPKFSFEVPNFKNWRLEVQSPTYLRFHPDDSVPFDFEEPPNILIFLEKRFSELKLTISDSTHVNKNNVSYKTLKIAGFSRLGVLFEEKDKKVILTFLDYDGHGMDKKLAEKILLDTFKFL